MLKNSPPSSPIITKKTHKSDGDFTEPPSRSLVKVIKASTVLTKAGKRAGTPIPYQFKTPLRITQRIHPLTSVKQSSVKANEKTALSEGHKDLKDLKIEQTEVKVKVDSLGIKAENADTEERKYVKILISSQKNGDESEKIPSQATVVMSNQVQQKIWFDNQDSGEEDEGYVTPYILAQEPREIGSEKEIEMKLKAVEIMKGKRRFFDKTPMYFPNKRVKKIPEFFQDSVRLYDKTRKEHIRFRLFKDKDLGNNKFVQTTLKESRIDDDCPTDSEQMEMAKKHIIKQLKQSMECQTPRNTPESLPRLSSSIGSRLNSSKFLTSDNFSEIGNTSSFVLRSDDDDDFTVDFHRKFSQRQDNKKVVKKLSYDEDSLIMMLNGQGFESAPASGSASQSEKSKEIIYFDMLN